PAAWGTRRETPFQGCFSAVPGGPPSVRESGSRNQASGGRGMRRIRKLGVLAAIGFAAGLTMAGTGTARADVIPPSPGDWAEIFDPYINTHGFSLCVDNPGGSSDIQKIQLYHCHGYASNGGPQRWFFTPVSQYNKQTGTIFT